MAVFKNKVLLIDFWASWCSPCIKSMPFFNSLYNDYQKQGFEIIAINVDEDSEAAQQFLKSNPVDYPIRFNSNGECPASFGVRAMPSSYLVDKTGRVRIVHLGYREGDQASIREQITKLLSE